MMATGIGAGVNAYDREPGQQPGQPGADKSGDEPGCIADFRLERTATGSWRLKATTSRRRRRRRWRFLPIIGGTIATDSIAVGVEVERVWRQHDDRSIHGQGLIAVPKAVIVFSRWQTLCWVCRLAIRRWLRRHRLSQFRNRHICRRWRAGRRIHG